jgi:elongation factor G
MPDKGSTRPIVSITLIPRLDDDESLQRVLRELLLQNPTAAIRVDAEDGVTTVRVMGDLDLVPLCRRLTHDLPVDANLPQVIYLETIRRSSVGEGKYIRQTGGRGNYAHVKIRLEPNEPGKGVEFVSEISSGVVPDAYFQPIEQGIAEAARGGVLAGYEVVDFRAMLYDGSFHEADSNDMAFKIAASVAFKEAARLANPVVLEPIVKVEFTVPAWQRTAFIDAVRARQGEVNLLEHNADGSLKIWAIAPLETMLGFDAPVPDETSFIGYREKPRADNGSDEAGSPVTRPSGPTQRSGSAAVDPDFDWT